MPARTGAPSKDRAAGKTADKPSGWKAVYRVVRRIPAGRVATYGQIAAIAGMPGAARQVGWALNALGDEDDVPWQRVINARGEISARGIREIEDLQRSLLESEGVSFDAKGRVDLGRYAWRPRGSAAVPRKAAKSSPSRNDVQRKRMRTQR
jgi:methylated-DNA-protein-cysteine methyltransferase-like protein